MKLVLQQLSVRGTCRMPYLAPDAAAALKALEKDTDGLIYNEMWMDGSASLLARRTRRITQLPGYSSLNYGMGIVVDVNTVLEEKKILYEQLLHIMKKRGWICHRRDGDESKPGYDLFNFLGDMPMKYLAKCTMDPITWDVAPEARIYEKFGEDFQLTMEHVQKRLSDLKIYRGPFTHQMDLYTRETVLAFQRAWDLIENGNVDMTLCRVLAFITAEVQYLTI